MGATVVLTWTPRTGAVDAAEAVDRPPQATSAANLREGRAGRRAARVKTLGLCVVATVEARIEAWTIATRAPTLKST